MAKKPNTSKETGEAGQKAPAKARAPKNSAKNSAKNSPKTGSGSSPKTVAKPAKPAKPANKPAPRKTTPPVAPPSPTGSSTDEIARRAYFLAEKRQKFGLPGDAAQDWIEAERQLAEESRAKKKAPRAKSAS